MPNASLSGFLSLPRARAHNVTPIRHSTTLASLVLLCCLQSACTVNEKAATTSDGVSDSQNTAEMPEPKNMSEKNTPETPQANLPNPATTAVPQEIMRKLVAAVADDSGVSVDKVVLERAQRSTFSDSSLDCPQPNMAYAQVIVEGYWVVFRAGNEEYDMRVTNRGTFTRCQGSTKRAPIRLDDT